MRFRSCFYLWLELSVLDCVIVIVSMRLFHLVCCCHQQYISRVQESAFVNGFLCGSWCKFLHLGVCRVSDCVLVDLHSSSVFRRTWAVTEGFEDSVSGSLSDSLCGYKSVCTSLSGCLRSV